MARQLCIAKPKGFFQPNKTKAMDNIGPFRSQDGKCLDSEDRCTTMNEYFLVFAYNDFVITHRHLGVHRRGRGKLWCQNSHRRCYYGQTKLIIPGPDHIFLPVLQETRDNFQAIGQHL